MLQYYYHHHLVAIFTLTSVLVIYVFVLDLTLEAFRLTHSLTHSLFVACLVKS